MGFEMYKKLAISLCCISLSGCAIDTSRDPNLNNLTGLEFKKLSGNEYIKNYSITSSTNGIDLEKAKICTLRNVTNRDVSLSDSSRSFVGAYTGNYYNLGNKSTSSGGNVVAASSDKSFVVNGSAEYIFDSGLINVKRVVRFTLDLSVLEGKVKYTFSNIQQAQTETGTIPNNGFNYIGTWKGASPYQALSSLRSVTSDIDSCLDY